MRTLLACLLGLLSALPASAQTPYHYYSDAPVVIYREPVTLPPPVYLPSSYSTPVRVEYNTYTPTTSLAPVTEYAPTTSLAPVESTLRRDTRFCPPAKPTRPSELVPVLPAPPPTRPYPTPEPAPQPTPRPQPPAPTACCDELIARLKALEAKIENMKATAELDAGSVDALAEAVAEKLKLPDISSLATKEDIQGLLAKLDGLATKTDVQNVAATQTNIVSLLEQLVELPSNPGDGGTADPNSLRELAILVQRQAGTISSLSNNVELLSKNVAAQGDKLKNIELAVQSHTVELARLVKGVDGVNASVGALDPRLDTIENQIRELSVRLQRLEGSSTASLSPVEKQQRVDEMIQALHEVLGGKIRLRLRFDPQTGEILGADSVQ